MTNAVFQTRTPLVAGNSLLRVPQREAYEALLSVARDENAGREVGIVLPVGCGKSGCITLAPFAFKSKRTLVIAPGLRISAQLYADFDFTQPYAFYIKTRTLDGCPYPEPVEIRGTTVNRGDLDVAEVVVTNIQQLQGEDNRWLEHLPTDYFDLILFDEGHHSVAATWMALKEAFPEARIVNFSATPIRADGQRMAGNIIYSYPVVRAIKEGYVKRLKALVLSPQSLKYIRREDDQEVEVSLDEVRRLGEQDAGFRRSIVTSKETLATIVDASIRELERIRAETQDARHKIIASALNYQHCIQIVEAYRQRGRRAAFVHSRAESVANEGVYQNLENHELDVIVQVRMLGEGFDHPYLSVAAVFSIFQSLSPFVQFVGRIMRVIEQNAPNHPSNQGTVVFHAGANVASRWEDFQEFSEADQEFFDALLPMETLNFSTASEITITPAQPARDQIKVTGQKEVLLEEIPLIQADPEAMRAIQTLTELGYSPEGVRRAMELQPVLTSAVRERQAARQRLDEQATHVAGRILRERGYNPKGFDLDRQRLGRTNFVVLKAAIDEMINRSVGRGPGERSDFTKAELEHVTEQFDELVQDVTRRVFDGKAQRMEVDLVLRAHNCQHNKEHRLERGEKRLKLRNKRSWDHYCAQCAVSFIERDIATLKKLAVELRGESLKETG